MEETVRKRRVTPTHDQDARIVEVHARRNPTRIALIVHNLKKSGFRARFERLERNVHRGDGAFEPASGGIKRINAQRAVERVRSPPLVRPD